MLSYGWLIDKKEKENKKYEGMGKFYEKWIRYRKIQ